MKENLQEISIWLKNNAPKILQYSLQSPVSEENFQNLERLIGEKIPADFKELYRWHNGLSDDQNFGSLFYGMDFFPLENVIAEYQSRLSDDEIVALDKADPEIDMSNINNPKWIKFAFDASHTGLYLDLAPSSFGQFGQIIFVDNEYEIGILVAKSTSGLIQNFCRDLQNNLYHLSSDALDDDMHFLEADSEIDLINWYDSEVWKR